MEILFNSNYGNRAKYITLKGNDVTNGLHWNCYNIYTIRLTNEIKEGIATVSLSLPYSLNWPRRNTGSPLDQRKVNPASSSDILNYDTTDLGFHKEHEQASPTQIPEPILIIATRRFVQGFT
jgi:hypothetical protein